MVRTVSVIAGLAVAVSSASAAFIGIAIREDKNTSSGSYPANSRTFNLYARFSGAGTAAGGGGFTNTVLSVGQPDTVSSIGITSGTFFQVGAPFGGNTAPNSGFFGFDPTLPFDSFVSIGRKISDGTAAPGTGAYSTSVDNDFNFGASSIRGGWFNSSPPNLQGGAVASGPDFLTLLAQFTVTGGAAGAQIGTQTSGPTVNMNPPAGQLVTDTTFTGAIFTGTLTIFTQGDVGAGQPSAITNVIHFQVPTPGSLALFGVAGLAVARRRRA